MKSIITTYPDFQALPRGVKMMLLTSENLFFSEIKSRPPYPRAAHPAGGSGLTNLPKSDFSAKPLDRRQQWSG